MKIIFNVGVFGKHGIEHALVNLLTELPQNSHQYILHEIYELDNISPLWHQIKNIVERHCSLPRSSFWGNLHMSRKKSIFYKLVDALGVLKIHSLIGNQLNKHQADVIVDYDLSLLRSAHIINAPKIGVFHFRPKRFRNGGRNKLRRIGERLRHYQKLVVLCDEMYLEACDVWPHLRDKLVILPNSININSVLKKSECLIHLPNSLNSKEYFVSVARLTPQKNIPLLLKSYALAKKQGCSWPLVIIGDGEEKNQLLNLCSELNIKNDVYFLGYQTNPYPYITNAGAFVMSSREEGFPVSLLEAMAVGCPIISLACPTGPTDILQNGKIGKLVPFTEKNPNELSIAMLEISHNQALRQTYAQESTLFIQNFSSHKITRDFMSLLRDMISVSKFK